MLMRKVGGFSVAEVTIAIGVIAFALLAIFALIPVGLNSSRDAIDDTSATLLLQDLQNRIRSEVATNVTAVAWTTGGYETFQLRWNQQILPPAGLSYSNIANVSATTYTGSPPPSTAVAYYDRIGLFVKQAAQSSPDVIDPTRNFVRADIIIRPLYCDATQIIPPSGVAPTYDANLTSYGEFVRPRATSLNTVDYAYLSVRISLGWPAKPVADGSLVATGAADKRVYTFYLQKP
jgi:uncharacterized protein (TIGR02598 family)